MAMTIKGMSAAAIVAQCLATLCLATPAASQTTSAGGPISGGAAWGFGVIKRNVTEAAQKMPEAEYSFKPVDGVRTFGQLVGHIANAQFAFCSTVKGEPSPSQGTNNEQL